ncbi:MAG: hypothetical protein KDB11_33180 [Planctomycetales bacterium]|nr:hypothetical protein [Planctomycetales bacterium]
MSESKIEATDRLRRESRWPEASRFKDASVKRLRAEGKTKAEANDSAWDEMLAAFPPLPAVSKPQASGPLDITKADPELLDRLADVPLDWIRDVRWVYQVFAHPSVELADAPSLGAWGLLGFARQERSKFFGIVSATLASKAKPDTDEEQIDSDPGLAELERMIAASRG